MVFPGGVDQAWLAKHRQGQGAKEWPINWVFARAYSRLPQVAPMIWRLSPAYALRASGRSAADRGIRSSADFDITRWMGRQFPGRQERPVLCAHPLGATQMGRPGVAAVPGDRAGGRAAAARGTDAAPRPQGAVRHLRQPDHRAGAHQRRWVAYATHLFSTPNEMPFRSATAGPIAERVQDAMRSRALALLEASGWCSSVQGAADTRTAQVRSLR